MNSLFENFYDILSIRKEAENSYFAEIHLNAQHEIFKGHFPDNPVTPGVCMVQIIKELSEQILSKKLNLKSVSNIKFTSIINPFENPILELNLNFEINSKDNIFKVKNSTSFHQTLALKGTLIFSEN